MADLPSEPHGPPAMLMTYDAHLAIAQLHAALARLELGDEQGAREQLHRAQAALQRSLRRR